MFIVEKAFMMLENYIIFDLIHFSNYDNLRSIPSLVDGLKPSQRKVLFAGFKKNLNTDIKVSQFVGYVSEQSAYHHGEMSLTNTIIGMAQNFVGSNNINLFIPSGQFGTRLMGGKDHSSARYIFTRLNKIARIIYNQDDDHILNYLEDDGMKVEPNNYVPIIPMVLVNGAEGIGTGFSTFLPKFSVKDIIFHLQERIKAGATPKYNWGQIKPSFNNHMGDVHKIDALHYISKGKFEIKDKRIEITELPIGMWSNEYKTYLEEITYGGDRLFGNLENFCTESKVHFVMKIADKKEVEEMHKEPSQIKFVSKLEKYLKLVKPISLTNIYLYNGNNYLTKYNTVSTILEEFYVLRLKYYEMRKDYLMKTLKKELDILDTKVKFITSIIEKKIDLSNKDKDIIIKMFENKKYYKIKGEPAYDYLLRMPFYSLTKTKVIELNTMYKKKKEEYEKIRKKTPSNIWLDDLGSLQKIVY